MTSIVTLIYSRAFQLYEYYFKSTNDTVKFDKIPQPKPYFSYLWFNGLNRKTCDSIFYIEIMTFPHVVSNPVLND